MELGLTIQHGSQVIVACNGQRSHSFDLQELDSSTPLQPPADPVAYGQLLYNALFRAETLARQTLDNGPERILLISEDDTIDAIPWEYAHGPEGFLVLEYPLLRALPTEQRNDAPRLTDGLHIVAVPSNPLDKKLQPLKIDSEWERLKKIISAAPAAVILKRTRPATLDRLRYLLINQPDAVVQFMGHGSQNQKGEAVLCFEQLNGAPNLITAQGFMRRTRNLRVFLVLLNSCEGAAPGPTPFSNLAQALVKQKIPYALGMRFKIEDEDARLFARGFYEELVRGTPVEEAVYQARQALATSVQAIGVPVLYTSLKTAAAGFPVQSGPKPEIDEYQPPIEVTRLPRAEGAFQGRIDELKQIGQYLTSDSPPALLTIHGGPGQGKTALAREAVERFTWAWPGGACATTLEPLPSRDTFVNDLASFLKLQPGADADALEHQVVEALEQHRTLLVLDNAETLVEAVQAKNKEAIDLAQFISQLPKTVSILATSRTYLNWPGEIDLGHDLEGLAPVEGARLFRQHAPQRSAEIDIKTAAELSEKVEGNPLCLRLLGGAFNLLALPLQDFKEQCEEHLLHAENTYVHVDHRHRTLYACIEASVHYLDSELHVLFSQLWIFHAPFWPYIAMLIFDPEANDEQHSFVPERLHKLWLRGLLNRETTTLRDDNVLLYYLLPVVRLYVEQYLKEDATSEQLLAQFGQAYANLAAVILEALSSSAAMVYIAGRAREDLNRGIDYTTGKKKGYYLAYWGWIMHRLGYRAKGLDLTEQALAVAQGGEGDRQLEGLARHILGVMRAEMGQPLQALRHHTSALHIWKELNLAEKQAEALNNIAMVYRNIGQPQQALDYFEQALTICRETKDESAEATTLNNIGLTYEMMGDLQQALIRYQEALLMRRKVGDYAGQAVTLNNIAVLYGKTGQLQPALNLLNAALSIAHEMGDPAGEVSIHVNIAAMLYDSLKFPQDAISHIEQAIAIMVKTSLPRSSAGDSVDDLRSMLERMRTGVPLTPPSVPSVAIAPWHMQQLINSTIAVMTTSPEHHAEWRAEIVEQIQMAPPRRDHVKREYDFLTAILAILDGQTPTLPADNPYAPAIVTILARISEGKAS